MSSLFAIETPTPPLAPPEPPRTWMIGGRLIECSQTRDGSIVKWMHVKRFDPVPRTLYDEKTGQSLTTFDRKAPHILWEHAEAPSEALRAVRQNPYPRIQPVGSGPRA